MDFALFVTQEPYRRLTKRVEGLQDDATGYSNGQDVRPVREIPGKFQVIHHNGHQVLGNYAIRVHKGMIISEGARGLIEEMLRRNQVHFREYEDVRISRENANSQSPYIRIPKREPNRIYNP